MIRKEVDDAEPKSPTGKWFRDPRNREQIDHYRSPTFVGPRERIKHISFEEVTGDVQHFNELLVWIGLPTLTERQFRGLLDVTKFEGTTSALEESESPRLRERLSNMWRVDGKVRG